MDANGLDDLELADEIALVFHKRNQMQDKLNLLDRMSQQLGLKTNRGKTKIITRPPFVKLHLMRYISLYS